MKFVKLKSVDSPETLLAARELSPTGVYRVKKRETDQGEDFVLLDGGKAWYSAALFEVVQ